MEKYNIEIERGIYPCKVGYKRILICRHGETDATLEKRYSEDERSLNAIGRATVIALKEKINKSLPTAVFSSPITRAIETTQIICNDFKVLNELRERNYGDWRGKTKNEIREDNRLRYLLGKFLPGIVTPPNGESLYQFYNRLDKLIDILWRIEEQDLLIVTHGSVIHSMMMYPHRMFLKNYWDFTKQHRILCGEVFTLYMCQR